MDVLHNKQNEEFYDKVVRYLESKGFYFVDCGLWVTEEVTDEINSGGIVLARQPSQNTVSICLTDKNCIYYSDREFVKSLDEAMPIIDRWATAIKILI